MNQDERRAYDKARTGSRQPTYATVRAWQARNPEKVSAHKVVARAITTGRLVRPEACEHCGTVTPLDASHTDYAQPLDVEWLCRSCHALKDRS